VTEGPRDLVVRGAREHNLQGFDLAIPRARLTVVTGVSGSGKSSLAFDTLFREGQRRFLETLPAFTRQFAGGLSRPAVTSVDGLGPAVAVGQRVALGNPRSTVGTLTEVWDLLRVLYARLGQSAGPDRPRRSLFSFNGPEGACPRCQGLGVEDRLDLDLLVADPARTLREGALRVSLPNGYLMYSQVTLAVLDQVLRAHGASVDIPWADLGEEARKVVLYGSDRLRIPYGKHPLESRLRWEGITARPRQEGFYRGLVPVMEEILRGKRNDSILRYARTGPCPDCAGGRLRPEALAVLWRGRRIVDLGALTAAELGTFLEAAAPDPQEEPVLAPIRAELLARCGLMAELGLDYLAFDRPAPTLSPGEAQRLRLLGLALVELRGLLVVLDEPSAGLHPHDVGRLVGVLRRLRDQGQTVVAVDHDPQVVRAADWQVDLGPGPGALGGRLLWSGPPPPVGDTPTARWLGSEWANPPRPPRPVRTGTGHVRLEGLDRHNLRGLTVDLALGALNVVTGVSGAGKTSLLEAVIARLDTVPGLRPGTVWGSPRGDEERAARAGGPPSVILPPFRRLVSVDAGPIGRTPRSNAATYTGAFDLIRDLFAATPEARALGLGKGHFSFNTAGGRCEACEGAGVVEVGMRHLGRLDLVCDACGGRRFHPEVLSVRYRGRTVADLLEGSVAQAAECFHDHPRLRRILAALMDCGLGHLPLGQPATALSGGEAQRVKLAAELAMAKPRGGGALIALDEPTAGLHAADVEVLLEAWDRLLAAGHTLLVADNGLAVVRAADQVIDLGPGSGPRGGRVVVAGPPAAVAACPESLTGRYLAGTAGPTAAETPDAGTEGPEPPMELRGVTTHNLRGLDLDLPATGLTVVTGPSGCGKSSLVFDTLLAEARNRFADLVSPWARRLLPRRGGVELASARGLRATVAVPQQPGRRNPRSRMGTVTELDQLLRLLFARAGSRTCPACGAAVQGGACACGQVLVPLWAAAFSPNAQAGACPRCNGLGFIQACDPERLVSHPERPLGAGALEGTRFGVYLGEPDGQHLAILGAVGQALGLDFTRPWRDLGPRERQVAMAGCGDRVFQVQWHYRRGRVQGVHRLDTPWAGLAALVDREYERTHRDAKGEALEELMAERECPECHGERLNPQSRAVTFAGRRLPELAAMAVTDLLAWLERGPGAEPAGPAEAELRAHLLRRLRSLDRAGLGYLAPGREMATLSGGEAQRVRLAAALGEGLAGVCYVLDEPTRGLHARDTARLSGLLRELADAGNAVVVVEHDPDLIARADWILELGPGAGPEGGRLVAAGTPAELRAAGTSRAGRLLERVHPAPPAARPFRPGVTVRGAFLHNLRGIDVAFPGGALVAVTGVSGSGKSSLVLGVLGASLDARRRGRGPVGCAGLELRQPLEDVLVLDQAGPGPGGAGSVATLAGVADRLRRAFAATPQAKVSGLAARHFGTAQPGGRCEACAGRGVVTVALDLLPDVTVGCEECQGRRFRPEVLACRIDGLSIADLLDATVQEAARRFPDDAGIEGPLGALAGVGLGYLRLGQESAALSAGERGRIQLAGLLARAGERPAAVLLDEPTRGLGAGETDRLLDALGALARAGHLVVAVEHDLDFIARADWVIDLGPEGGAGGGALVAQGAPRAVAAGGGHTGRALAGRLA
jgi:excinuclease ABC subunit A